jgi:hypothetical protein
VLAWLGWAPSSRDLGGRRLPVRFSKRGTE